MRLIDADALIAKLKDEMELMIYDGIALIYTQAAINELKRAPTVDATEVIRCKYCKHYNAGLECLKDGYGIEYPQDYFCGSAERRQDG